MSDQTDDIPYQIPFNSMVDDDAVSDFSTKMWLEIETKLQQFLSQTLNQFLLQTIKIQFETNLTRLIAEAFSKCDAAHSLVDFKRKPKKQPLKRSDPEGCANCLVDGVVNDGTLTSKGDDVSFLFQLNPVSLSDSDGNPDNNKWMMHFIEWTKEYCSILQHIVQNQKFIVTDHNLAKWINTNRESQPVCGIIILLQKQIGIVRSESREEYLSNFGIHLCQDPGTPYILVKNLAGYTSPKKKPRYPQNTITMNGKKWLGQHLRWMGRFVELIEFKIVNGNCDVPRSYDNKKLSAWVHNQRRRRRSVETYPRVWIELLSFIGFRWAPDTN